jgi:hypothetical protein
MAGTCLHSTSRLFLQPLQTAWAIKHKIWATQLVAVAVATATTAAVGGPFVCFWSCVNTLISAGQVAGATLADLLSHFCCIWFCDASIFGGVQQFVCPVCRTPGMLFLASCCRALRIHLAPASQDSVLIVAAATPDRLLCCVTTAGNAAAQATQLGIPLPHPPQGDPPPPPPAEGPAGPSVAGAALAEHKAPNGQATEKAPPPPPPPPASSTAAAADAGGCAAGNPSSYLDHSMGMMSTPAPATAAGSPIYGNGSACGVSGELPGQLRACGVWLQALGLHSCMFERVHAVPAAACCR